MMFRRLFFLGAVLALCHAASAATTACSGSLHIELQNPGVYALDYASIIASQPSLKDCASADLVLRNQGKEIPLRVVDDSDGVFGPNAHIEWTGESLHGPESWFDQYSIANVYLLSAEPGQHARMQSPIATHATPVSGTPLLLRQVHLEQDNLMIRLNQSLVKPGEEPDVWQWAKLTHVDTQPFSFDFDLADLDSKNNTEISATLDFRGLSDVLPGASTKATDHVVQITLNGNVLEPLGWDGRAEVRKEIHIPARLLKSRGNTLALRVPLRRASATSDNPLVDVVMFNFIELTYPITGSLDASSAPFMLDGKTPVPIELQQNGKNAPAVYTAKGDYLPAHAVGNGRWHVDQVPPNVTLYVAANAQALAPTRLQPVATTDWRKSDAGYDYLIVAHPRLIAAIQPLAEFHRSHGLKVAVIDVNDIYDQFNGGIDHPRAIRNLVQYGVEHWPTKPRFVLLVGDASFDIRHENPDDASMAKWATHDYELLIPDHFDGIPATAYSAKPKDLVTRNLIPTWQFPSEEGQSASDNPFVAFTDDDFHPTVAIGRFPVVEPSEVTAIVNKTIAYFTKPQPGAWRRDVMFIANEDSYFQTSSDEIATQLESEGFAARKIYGNAAEKDNIAHQADIKQSLNDGQLLVHFLGHGGRFIWRTGPPDLLKNHDLFTLDDVSQLHNGGRLPMVLSMTCYSAPFDNPTEDSIGERFLREPDKGAVAVFAASWRNSPDPAYSKALIAELLTQGQTIGAAIIKAKRKISDRTLVETYNLLGDPALVLDRPKDTLALARETDRWSTRVAVKLPGNLFHGVVNVDWLDVSGKTVQSNAYTVDDVRFDLPAPSMQEAPASVLVYAADASRGRDAIGELTLMPAPIKVANGPRPRDTLALTHDIGRWESQVIVALPNSEFHGEVKVDWQDIRGKSLATDIYQVEGTRFRLPPPNAEILPQLAQVHVLASDPQQSRDAAGQLFLVEAPAKGVLIIDPPVRGSALIDTISKTGFESGEVKPSKIAIGQVKVTPPETKDKSG